MKSTGISFLGLLALIFIGLKLAGVGVVSTWSWWAVLSPLWVPWAIAICILAPVYVVMAVEKAWWQR